jgi:hypothetical protein
VPRVDAYPPRRIGTDPHQFLLLPNSPAPHAGAEDGSGASFSSRLEAPPPRQGLCRFRQGG